MSQTLSEPCCVDHGPDACGASLFCAAFDGRVQPTCYMEHSRLVGEECNGDRHCASRSCNRGLAACRAIPGEACTVAVGCSSKLDGEHYVCADGSCRRSTGERGAHCGEDDDCDSERCREGRCACPEGEAPCDRVCTPLTDECDNWGRCGPDVPCTHPDMRCGGGSCVPYGTGQAGEACDNLADCDRETVCVIFEGWDGQCLEICTPGEDDCPRTHRCQPIMYAAAEAVCVR